MGYDIEKELIELRETVEEKPKSRNYQKIEIDRNKLKKLQNETWWAVNDTEGYLRRDYVSGRRVVAKRLANKKVRRASKVSDGSNYKKIYDVEYSVF